MSLGSALLTTAAVASISYSCDAFVVAWHAARLHYCHYLKNFVTTFNCCTTLVFG